MGAKNSNDNNRHKTIFNYGDNNMDIKYSDRSYISKKYLLRIKSYKFL